MVAINMRLEQFNIHPQRFRAGLLSFFQISSKCLFWEDQTFWDFEFFFFFLSIPMLRCNSQKCNPHVAPGTNSLQMAKKKKCLKKWNNSSMACCSNVIFISVAMNGLAAVHVDTWLSLVAIDGLVAISQWKCCWFSCWAIDRLRYLFELIHWLGCIWFVSSNELLRYNSSVNMSFMLSRANTTFVYRTKPIQTHLLYRHPVGLNQITVNCFENVTYR